jgi:hypothetical protein
MVAKGSKFSINLYPYWDYHYYAAGVTLNYALGNSGVHARFEYYIIIFLRFELATV